MYLTASRSNDGGVSMPLLWWNMHMSDTRETCGYNPRLSCTNLAWLQKYTDVETNVTGRSLHHILNEIALQIIARGYGRGGGACIYGPPKINVDQLHGLR